MLTDHIKFTSRYVWELSNGKQGKLVSAIIVDVNLNQVFSFVNQNF